MPRIIDSKQEPRFTECEENELNQDLQFLSDQEHLGICTEEIHENDKIAWEYFINTTKRVGEEFIVRMPYNDKIDMLKTNEFKSAARARCEQMMIKSPAYMTAMCKAHNTLSEFELCSRVAPRFLSTV